LSCPKIKMLRRWAINPEPIKEEIAGFAKRIKDLGDEYSDDPAKAIDILLQEMLDHRLEMEEKKRNKKLSWFSLKWRGDVLR
jgi:hypothetical protein